MTDEWALSFDVEIISIEILIKFKQTTTINTLPWTHTAGRRFHSLPPPQLLTRWDYVIGVNTSLNIKSPCTLDEIRADVRIAIEAIHFNFMREINKNCKVDQLMLRTLSIRQNGQ